MVQLDLAVHVEIEVEHEHALLRRLAGAVVDLAQQARAGFDVGLRAAGHLHGRGQLVLHKRLLLRVLIAHQAQKARRDELLPEAVLQSERRSAEGVDIPQTHAGEPRGMICLDKYRENAVEPLGKFLPAGIAVGRKGDKALGETDFPLPLGRDELIVVDRSLRDGLAVHHLRRQLLDLLFILRIFPADAVLKRGRLACVDGQDLREAELTDHLDQLALGVDHSFFIGKHGSHTFRCFSSIIL